MDPQIDQRLRQLIRNALKARLLAPLRVCERRDPVVALFLRHSSKLFLLQAYELLGGAR